MATFQTTILLVEDDPNDVMLIQRAARKVQLRATWQTVADGEAAVAYLQGTGPYSDRSLYPLPALMLLDLKLPRMLGMDVLAWVRQQETLRRLPVVVLTSSRQTSEINRAYDLGANSYLVKPVASEELLHLVQTLNQYWLSLNEPPSWA